MLPARTRTAADMKAYAVRAPENSQVTLFVINKDRKAAGTIAITPSERIGHAHNREQVFIGGFGGNRKILQTSGRLIEGYRWVWQDQNAKFNRSMDTHVIAHFA